MDNSTSKAKLLGGRPKKAEAERRLRRHNLRFTISEAQHVERLAAAASQPVTEYIRDKALASSPAPSADQPSRDLLLARLLRELNAVGVNLNQIAHAHNAGRDTRTGWEPVQAELLRVLEKVGAEFS